MEVKTKRNLSIDAFRLIAAFFIVIVHVDFGNLNIEIVENLRLSARWAVPYFFVVSGYFVASKVNYDGGRFELSSLSSLIKKMISVLFISISVYYILNIISGHLEFKLGWLLTGNYFHLWFPSSLIIGFLFNWYLCQFNNYKFAFVVCLLIFIYCLIADSYDNVLIKSNLDYSLGRTLSSIPFVFIGFTIYKINKVKIKSGFLGLLLIGGFLLQYLESNILFYFYEYSRFDHQLLIGTLITVVSLVLLLIKHDIKSMRLSKLGKEHSLFIYLYHPFIYFFIKNTIFNRFDVFYLEMISPVLVFTMTLFISIILSKRFSYLYKILNGEINLRR